MPDLGDNSARSALRQQREQAIERLSEYFVRGTLEVEEYEARVDRTHRAETVGEVDAILAEVTPHALEEPERALAHWSASQALQGPSTPGDRKWIIAILGGTQRRGRWRVPRRLNVVTFSGGATLDFREAVFLPGVSEVRITSFMGGVSIIVPPALAVECSGVGIMGGVASLDRTPRSPDPQAPLLRIHGVVVMGGIGVVTRPTLTNKSAPRQ